MTTTFAQKFNTTFVSDGLRIHVMQDCPVPHIKGTIPTHVRLQIFTWNTSYTITVSGTPLVTDDAVVPSEEIEDDEMWIYLLWKPLSAGTYLWLLTVQSDASHDSGTFRVLYDPDSTKFNGAYEDGTFIGKDFDSEVFELNSGEYESPLSYRDSSNYDAFGSYRTYGGHSNIQINRNTVDSPIYGNSVKVQDPVTNGSRKTGRIASGSLVEIN